MLSVQVRVDVERSLYSFAGFLSDSERSARREELERLLNAVVVKHEGAHRPAVPHIAVGVKLGS